MSLLVDGSAAFSIFRQPDHDIILATYGITRPAGRAEPQVGLGAYVRIRLSGSRLMAGTILAAARFCDACAPLEQDPRTIDSTVPAFRPSFRRGEAEKAFLVHDDAEPRVLHALRGPDGTLAFRTAGFGKEHLYRGPWARFTATGATALAAAHAFFDCLKAERDTAIAVMRHVAESDYHGGMDSRREWVAYCRKTMNTHPNLMDPRA
jgi:hypothetical protein